MFFWIFMCRSIDVKNALKLARKGERIFSYSHYKYKVLSCLPYTSAISLTFSVLSKQIFIEQTPLVMKMHIAWLALVMSVQLPCFTSFNLDIKELLALLISGAANEVVVIYFVCWRLCKFSFAPGKVELKLTYGDERPVNSTLEILYFEYQSS